MSAERRIDPDDGVAYTYDELAAFYAGIFKKKAIEAYWENDCTPVKQKRRKARVAAAAPEPEPEGRAKSREEAERPPPPAPEMGYWKIRGLAAPCRMMFAYAGVEVKDTQYEAEDDWFGKDKPKLAEKNPLANLPYVVEGNRVVTQTNAVLMYIARRCRMAGSRRRQSDVEMLLCQAYDLRLEFVQLVYPDFGMVRTASEYEEKKKDFISGAAGPHLDKFEKVLAKGSPFLAGPSPSAADFHVWELVDQMELWAKDNNQDSPCKERPALKAFYDRFRALDKLQAYFASPSCALPCNLPGASFWSGPGATIPSDLPK